MQLSRRIRIIVNVIAEIKGVSPALWNMFEMQVIFSSLKIHELIEGPGLHIGNTKRGKIRWTI